MAKSKSEKKSEPLLPFPAIVQKANLLGIDFSVRFARDDARVAVARATAQGEEVPCGY
jgi:hypothetical protein